MIVWVVLSDVEGLQAIFSTEQDAQKLYENVSWTGGVYAWPVFEETAPKGGQYR